MGLMGASPSALFSFSAVSVFIHCAPCQMLVVSGKLSDCSSKGGQPHRRRRNLKGRNHRHRTVCVAGGQIDGGCEMEASDDQCVTNGNKAPFVGCRNEALAVLNAARSRQKRTRACPRPLSPKPGRRRGATVGSGGTREGAGAPPGGSKAGRGSPRDWRVSRHAPARRSVTPPQSNKPAAILSASHRRRIGGGARNPRPTTATF